MSRTLLAEALFASPLRPSDVLEPAEVRAVIAQTLEKLGPTGCLGAMAQEFGDHPETAAARMRWALAVVQGAA